MTLLFEFRRSFGRERFYPKNPPSTAICAVNARSGLNVTDLTMLESAGFKIRVDQGNIENLDWRQRGQN